MHIWICIMASESHFIQFLDKQSSHCIPICNLMRKTKTPKWLKSARFKSLMKCYFVASLQQDWEEMRSEIRLVFYCRETQRDGLWFARLLAPPLIREQEQGPDCEPASQCQPTPSLYDYLLIVLLQWPCLITKSSVWLHHTPNWLVSFYGNYCSACVSGCWTHLQWIKIQRNCVSCNTVVTSCWLHLKVCLSLVMFAHQEDSISLIGLLFVMNEKAFIFIFFYQAARSLTAILAI